MRKKARTPATLRGTTLVSARQDNDFTLDIGSQPLSCWLLPLGNRTDGEM
jgi:hypothetical protein